jgi:hypothetical protein
MLAATHRVSNHNGLDSKACTAREGLYRLDTLAQSPDRIGK